MRYGFIGTGNMASAIIRGAIGSGEFMAEDILGYNHHIEKARALQSICGMRVCETLEELAQSSDILVLCVKPQVLPSVLPQLKPLAVNKRIVSIAAGKSLAYLEEQLGELPIMRVMPNINAVVGASTSCICANAFASAKDVENVKKLFATVGMILDLPEAQIPIFAAVAGASPAFTYTYIDALACAAVRAGMPRKTALEIAAASVQGSAKMLAQSGEDPHALAAKVCSPGGTTIEGMHCLKIHGFEGVVEDAVAAVIEKDRKL